MAQLFAFVMLISSFALVAHGLTCTSPSSHCESYTYYVSSPQQQCNTVYSQACHQECSGWVWAIFSCDNVCTTNSQQVCNTAYVQTPQTGQRCQAHWSGNQCDISDTCPAGTFSPAGTGYQPCSQCPGGTTSAAGTARSSDCYDTGPPRIANCPGSRTVYANSGVNTVVVTWATITATDVVGQSVVVRAVAAPQASGAAFPVGTYQYTYTATNVRIASQVSTCSFTITVKVTTCSPVPSTPGLVATAPPSLTYGQCYSFSCASGYVLSGVTRACCDRSTPTSDTGFWNWGNGGSPTCAAQCTAGTYSSTGTGYQPCTQCPAGTSSSAGALRQSDCFDVGPPTIVNCPTSKTVYIDRGVTTAVVTWPSITASSANGQSVPVIAVLQPFSSGSAFPVGTYQFKYTATNIRLASQVTICQFNVTVLATVCAAIPAQPKLTAKPPTSLTYGFCYDFTCAAGTLMQGPKNVCCERQTPTSPTGYWSWGAGLSATSCLDVCLSGTYSLNGTGYSPCNTCPIGTVSLIGSKAVSDCYDSLPPVFKNCPASRTVYTDRGLNTTNVNWNAVSATNVTGQSVPIKPVTQGPTPGSAFAIGTYLYTYTATNERVATASSTCHFTITVQATICSALPYQAHLIATPPTSLTYYGFCYNFTCDNYYTIQGPSQACCERNTSSPQTGYWDWGPGGSPTTCLAVTCPRLTAPANGAMACGNNKLAYVCLYQCQNPYEPALVDSSVPSFASYVCDPSSATWLPREVPIPPLDCSVTQPVDGASMESAFYFSGNCSDSATTTAIANNLFTMLNTSSFLYNGLCNVADACSVANVDVICDPSVRRRRTPTATNKVQLILAMKAAYSTNGSMNVTQLRDDMTRKLSTATNRLKQAVQNGTVALTAPRRVLQVDRSSFVTANNISLICPAGYSGRASTFRCVICPAGTYSKTSAEPCVPCPLGTYQNLAGQSKCRSCPERKSTATTFSTSERQCTVSLAPGHDTHTREE